MSAGKTAEERLRLLGLDTQLPPPPKPLGMYRPCLIVEGNCLYVSGHGPIVVQGDGSSTLQRGKVGMNDMTVEEAKQAARRVALAILSTVRAHLGSLNRVKRVIKSLVMVNGIPEFEEHIKVANGYAEVLFDVFGSEYGVGTRSAVGMGSLPGNIPVEVEATFEITNADCTQEAAVSTTVQSLMDSCSPILNALATATSLGGSRLHPAALTAMREISARYVDLNLLLSNAGRQVARLARAPDGYAAHIVTGAAAGLAHAVSACLTGKDTTLVRMLPDVSQLERVEVILDGASDQRWNQSIALTGAKLKIVGSIDQPMNADSLKSALSTHTAAVVWFDGYVSNAMALQQVLQVAHASEVPVIVDAAARLPPVSNLWTITGAGVDCVLFSGGKAMRGPQTSGIMIGRSALIEAARLNGSPNEAAVCRPMKCSKECIVGLVAALEAFVSEQPQGGYEADWNARAEVLVDMLRNTTGVAIHLENGPSDIQPSNHRFVHVSMQASTQLKRSEGEGKLNHALYGDAVDHGNPLAVAPVGVAGILASRLAKGSPRICTNTTKSGILLNPQTITNEELPVLVNRIQEEVGKMLQEGLLEAAAISCKARKIAPG